MQDRSERSRFGSLYPKTVLHHAHEALCGSHSCSNSILPGCDVSLWALWINIPQVNEAQLSGYFTRFPLKKTKSISLLESQEDYLLFRRDPRPSSLDGRAQALSSRGRSQFVLLGLGSGPCLLFFSSRDGILQKLRGQLAHAQASNAI